VTEAILTLNAGSSSLKFALFRVTGSGVSLTARGQVEGLGSAPHLVARDAAGAQLMEQRWPEGAHVDPKSLLRPLFAWAEAEAPHHRLAAVGHRVVHGGQTFNRPVLIDEGVLAALDALTPLAPLHQPHSLGGIRAAQAIRPDLPQVACFDTAFHHDHTEVVTRFALPRAWHDQGVRRYGFHGLSYEYVAGRLRELDPRLAGGKVVVAHLGSGASLCALDNGRSVDTTMSFTPLDGLVMGTRCGALDPGVVLYLLQHAGLTAQAVQTLLYEQSGLLGVSGQSSDMRSLVDSPDPQATEAVELFTFRVIRETGALMASMGGLDGIVFTGGIGENAPAVRAAIVKRLAWTGLELDAQANASGLGRISAATSRLQAWAVATDEEAMIAHHTLATVVKT
jgi:acetate kinase